MLGYLRDRMDVRSRTRIVVSKPIDDRTPGTESATQFMSETNFQSMDIRYQKPDGQMKRQAQTIRATRVIGERVSTQRHLRVGCLKTVEHTLPKRLPRIRVY